MKSVAGMFAKKNSTDKAPLIGGSAAMMLKGMGINPDELDKVAQEVIGAIISVDARLSLIEARQLLIMAKLGIPITDAADVAETLEAASNGA